LPEGTAFQVNLAEGGEKVLTYSSTKGTLAEQINAAPVRR